MISERIWFDENRQRQRRWYCMYRVIYGTKQYLCSSQTPEYSTEYSRALLLPAGEASVRADAEDDRMTAHCLENKISVPPPLVIALALEHGPAKRYIARRDRRPPSSPAGKPTLYGYTRASTKSQTMSPETQAAMIQVYADRNKDRYPPLAHAFSDPAKTSKVPLHQREGGARLLKHLKDGDHVVVARLDRLARSTVEALTLFDEFTRREIHLHIVDHAGQSIQDSLSPMGKFFYTVMAGFAEMERAMISERTREALMHLRDESRKYTGVLSGLMAVEIEGKAWFKPDPQRAPMVAYILKAYSERNMRPYEIAAELKELGMYNQGVGNWKNTPHRTDGWHPRRIRELLRAYKKHPHFAAMVMEYVPGTDPQLVPAYRAADYDCEGVWANQL